MACVVRQTNSGAPLSKQALWRPTMASKGRVHSATREAISAISCRNLRSQAIAGCAGKSNAVPLLRPIRCDTSHILVCKSILAQLGHFVGIAGRANQASMAPTQAVFTKHQTANSTTNAHAHYNVFTIMEDIDDDHGRHDMHERVVALICPFKIQHNTTFAMAPQKEGSPMAGCLFASSSTTNCTPTSRHASRTA